MTTTALRYGSDRMSLRSSFSISFIILTLSMLRNKFKIFFHPFLKWNRVIEQSFSEENKKGPYEEAYEP